MGGICCSQGKGPGVTDDECIPEKASGRYSSLNPSRRCSFMLESPRPSADNTMFSKTPAPGSPAANYTNTLSVPTNISAEEISHALQLEYTNPMYSPLLIKVLRPAGKQVQAAKEEGSEGVSFRGSSNTSPLTTFSWSMDVEVMSSEWPSWQDQKSSDRVRNQDLHER
ncbi:hypothetical protein Mapa_006727 [Marchantia paleacea]|nr:hypothetical protein Mapa_006727 [Marchantia paleacea]